MDAKLILMLSILYFDLWQEDFGYGHSSEAWSSLFARPAHRKALLISPIAMVETRFHCVISPKSEDDRSCGTHIKHHFVASLLTRYVSVGCFLREDFFDGLSNFQRRPASID